MNLNRRSFLAGIFTLPVLNKLVPKKIKYKWTKTVFDIELDYVQNMIIPLYNNPGIKSILTDIKPPEGY